MTTHKIRILLVDDHAIVRAGFKMLLATQEAIEVIAEASRGETALQQYQTLIYQIKYGIQNHLHHA
ncbi:DNA-binding response regulator [bacterium]|nr:DNA-binding response regulator [bacterium]